MLGMALLANLKDYRSFILLDSVIHITITDREYVQFFTVL